MTPQRYLYCLEALRLSQRGLAPLLACSDRLPRHWATGKQVVPDRVAEWLEACVEIREQHPDPPPPADWRRKALPIRTAVVFMHRRKPPKSLPPKKPAPKPVAKLKGKTPLARRMELQRSKDIIL